HCVRFGPNRSSASPTGSWAIAKPTKYALVITPICRASKDRAVASAEPSTALIDRRIYDRRCAAANGAKTFTMNALESMTYAPGGAPMAQCDSSLPLEVMTFLRFVITL